MTKRKVLIIDVQPTTRWVLRNYFEGRGYEAAEAESGIEALAQAERFNPDALVMDCHLPTEENKELVKQVRSVLGNIPVIVLAWFERIDEAIYAMRLGIDKESKEDVPLLEVEKEYIERILRKNDENVEKAAAVLKISRSSLYERIRKYKISTRNRRDK